MGRRWNSWGSSGYPGSGGGGGMGIDALAFDSPIAIIPNNVVNIRWCPPADITVTAIVLYFFTQPATAGTYLFTCTGAGNNLLNAANYAMTGIVADTYTAMALTGTAANLDLAASAKCVFTFTSNNLDLTGTGGYIQVRYVGN